MRMVGVEPYSDEFLKKADRVGQKLQVPSDIDSPFFVARFLRGNNGDEVTTLRKIQDYLTHRSVLGYDKMTDEEILKKNPMTKAVFERFSISRLDPTISSNNCHVFVQRMEGSDLKEIMKVVPLSYVLHSYFCLQEMFCRCLAKTENATGRPSGVICVLDLTGLNLSDFMNPLGGPAKVARLVVKIWADYFSENMIKLVIINSPGLVSLMFKVTKILMDEQTAQRLSFLNSVEELRELIEPQAIPVRYGGQWRDTSGHSEDPDNVVNLPKPVMKEEHRSEEQVWLDNGYIKPPAARSFAVKGKTHHDVVKKCNTAGQKLVWNFTTSSDIEFEVLKVEGGKEVAVWPRITLTSLKVPEQGTLECESGDYILRYTNSSSTWFPVKINLACELK